MQRIRYIATFEYLRHIKRRGFLLTTFGVPLLMIGAFALLFTVIMLNDQSEQAIGYVDQAGVVQPNASLPTSDDPVPQRTVPLQSYPDSATAQAAFSSGEIDAYVVLPADYLTTGAVEIYGTQPLSNDGNRSLRELLRASLLTSTDSQIALRVVNPTEELTLSALDGSRTMEGFNLWVFLLPYLFGLLFLITTFSSSSYLLQAIVEEKENRTMEMVVTSVTPHQLIIGKTLGLGGLGLTQAFVWLVFLGLPAALSTAFVPFLGNFRLPIDLLVVAFFAFVFGYLLFASLMVGIGAMATSLQEAQQMASLLSLSGMLPFILNFVIITNPNGAVAVGMSLFPLSAPLALVMRMPLAQVPLWQIGLSLSLLAISALLVMFGVGRVFRAGMLRYGKAMRIQELWSTLRAS